MRRTLVTVAITAGALVAFAANSVLCRLALGTRAIDAGAFTLVRLAVGALVLWLLRAGSRSPAAPGRDRLAPFLLFAYAAAFSFAYRSLTAGTGALILFGAVQMTMFIAASRTVERPGRGQIGGVLVALGGLVYLVSPGLSAPPAVGSALMATAGVAWGFYSLRGRRSRDPLADTAFNFAGALPYAAVVAAVGFRGLHLTMAGVVWAALSGGIASGLGYVTWYAALRRLDTVRAATVQLAVPVIAAAGGVLCLGERVSTRLLLAAVMILGGIGITFVVRTRPGRA
ncbi:MAG: DMT family transporter [Candidatus Eisenbacteria bacterium]